MGFIILAICFQLKTTIFNVLSMLSVTLRRKAKTGLLLISTAKFYIIEFEKPMKYHEILKQQYLVTFTLHNSPLYNPN